MLQVVETAAIARDPAQLWQRIGNFASVGEWHPMLSRVECEGEGAGATRSVTGQDRSQQVERLLEVRPEQRRHTYRLEQTTLPVSNYVAEFRVDPDAAGSRAVWSATFDAAAGREAEAVLLVRGFLKAGLAHLEEIYGRAAPVARLMGINHVALEVGDLDAALDFYGKVFSFGLRGRHGRMAFIELGDQFIALSEGRSQPPDTQRHFGLVVDDRSGVRERALAAGATPATGPGLEFTDPWGNHIEVVEYKSIQFTKAEPVLGVLGAEGGKSDSAKAELRQKGIVAPGR